MPKLPYTPEFVAGYVQRAMEEMRELVHRLNDRRDLREPELVELGVSIGRINADIAVQRRFIVDGRMDEKMREYDRLYSMAMRKWEEARTRAGMEAQMPEPPPSPIRFGDVNMEDYVEQPRPVFERIGEQPEDDSLSIFASDNEDPLPLHRMSVVKPARTFRPLRAAPSADRRSGAEPHLREEDEDERRLRQIARMQLERQRPRERQELSRLVVDIGRDHVPVSR